MSKMILLEPGKQITLELVKDLRVMIWSEEHQLYWRNHAIGYTYDPSLAGVYSFAHAVAISYHLGPEKRIRFIVVESDDSFDSNGLGGKPVELGGSEVVPASLLRAAALELRDLYEMCGLPGDRIAEQLFPYSQVLGEFLRR